MPKTQRFQLTADNLHLTGVKTIFSCVQLLLNKINN